MSAVRTLTTACRFVPLAALLLLTACSTTREVEPRDTATRGAAIAALASEFLGAPYRYGGSSPDGFDCSGLVSHVFAIKGLIVPRTTTAQHQATLPVPQEQLRPGDLVFFRFSGRVDHVGIYVGEGSFVHAPRAGRPVSRERLDDAYYQRRYAGAGRVPGSEDADR
jgi:cell wall-associated NlpC family hydrolase